MSIMRCRSSSGWTKGLRVRTSRRRSYGRRSMGMDKGWAGRAHRGHRQPRLDGLRGRREQLAQPGDVMRAGAAGQQAVVANAVEAVRQDVNEEAANELGDGERHRL